MSRPTAVLPTPAASGGELDYVDLDRSLAPLRKDEPASLELGHLGRRYGGWKSWADLLQYPRVVVLAEASSGKTAELKGQAQKLVDQGEPAFFLRLEDLADFGLEEALAPGRLAPFRSWRDARGRAWFFLDSVDETRLNRKSFETALRRFASALGDAAADVHVIVSCRASDWRGRADRQAIEQMLPPPRAAAQDLPDDELDPDAALLGPIFDAKPSYRDEIEKEDAAPEPPGLLVVQLTPLTGEQCRDLAVRAGTPDVDAFLDALPRFGLETFAERPGDLLELAAYWREKRAFGSLAEMAEHAVTVKLREVNAFRADSGELSPQEAREGAERLAAALTFGRSFTLLAAGDEADPILAAGALDPAHILLGWNDAKRAALLRRAIFAPSTYGRLRFHHRTTQEFLAASWLNRMLHAGAAMTAVWNVLFAKRYGVETVVPSLRPVAAWLALKQPAIRDEMIRREPVALLSHGDPRSLPLESRKALLRAYAERDAAGELSEARIEHRAIWLFSDPGLAGAIREAWALNPDHGFRTDLVRCIREAKIAECADLALDGALDAQGPDYKRGVAADALVECQATGEIVRLVAAIRDPNTSLTTQLAASFAEALYPAHLDAGDVVTLFGRAQPPPERVIDGIGHHVEELARRGGLDQRRALASGLAHAALRGPFRRRREKLIPRHAEIIRGLAGFMAEELERLGPFDPPSDDLLILLQALTRAGYDCPRDDGPDVRVLLQQKPRVNQALFWRNVSEARADFAELCRPWQVFVGEGAPLWGLGPADLEGLAVDVRSQALALDREVALAAVVQILRGEQLFETQAAWLDELVAGDAALQAVLARFRAPEPEDNHQRRWEVRNRRLAAVQAAREAKDKESWREFQRRLQAEPTLLSDPKLARAWTTGGFRLWDLARWLAGRKEHRFEAVVLRWRDLTPVFGATVAEAFRDGLRAFWRGTHARRPKYTSQNHLTTYRSTPLAFGGVSVEAAEDPDWIGKLDAGEVRRATEHAVMSELSYPDWLDQLLASRRDIAMPVVLAGIHVEWRRKWGTPTLLRHYARNAEEAPPELADKIAQLFRAGRPGNEEVYRLAVEFLLRRTLSARDRANVAGLARRRWRSEAAAGALARGRLNLTLAMGLAPAVGLEELEAWIASGQPPADDVVATIGDLFGRDASSLPAAAWARFTVPDLERLVRMAYRHIPRSQDSASSGARRMEARDYARQARDASLSSLLARPGYETFAVLRRLAEAGGDFELSAHRLRELAHRRAESDAEFEAWSPAEVLVFEAEQTAPATTGAELLRIVEGVLQDIQLSFSRADASSGSILTLAPDETPVQLWLAEQLNLRAAGRYHAVREAEVADENKPDVLVTSAHGPIQVAVEVKHGGMDWSPRALQAALRRQLADQYLLPENRRHGVLVITHHGARTWRNPDTGARWLFGDLMPWLDAEARAITRNVAGSVELRAIGLDPHAKS